MPVQQRRYKEDQYTGIALLNKMTILTMSHDFMNEECRRGRRRKNLETNQVCVRSSITTKNELDRSHGCGILLDVRKDDPVIEHDSSRKLISPTLLHVCIWSKLKNFRLIIKCYSRITFSFLLQAPSSPSLRFFAYTQTAVMTEYELAHSRHHHLLVHILANGKFGVIFTFCHLVFSLLRHSWQALTTAREGLA